MMTRSLGVLATALLALAATACGDDGGNNNGQCGDGHVTGNEACDDGNTTNGDGCSSTCRSEGMCGNGVFDVSTEECDDGNTVDGDGCSASCNREGTCGNGTVEPGETCDDANTDASDGCSSQCATESGYTCTGMPSTCTPDGGNASCSAPTQITLTAMGNDLVGMASGDTTNATNGLAEADCDGIASGAGKDNIFTFTTTDVRDVIIVMTPDVDFDGSVRMMTAPCDVNTQVVDQILDDGCSDYGGGGEYEALFYVDLPAGTYYVAIDGYEATDAGSYMLEITAMMPTCGDGILGDLEYCDDGNTTDDDGCTHCVVDDGYNCDTSEPSVCQAEGCGDGLIQTGEDCDDDNTDPDDGCSATCEVEPGYTCTDTEPSVCFMPGCGNGFIEDTEECDDGNEDDGDRCSASCILEYDTAEAAEPNDTTPQVLSDGNHIISGTFEDGDVDLYTFTLTATSRVEIETYATINGTDSDYDGVGALPIFDCPSTNDDSHLAVFDAADDPTDDTAAIAADEDDGDQYCSYLGPRDSDEDDNATADPTQLAALPAGTYTIRVIASTLNVVEPGTRYLLDLKITPMSQAAVPPAAGDLKINEFMANDGGTTNDGVDTNCDGSLTDSNDEFIELVNVSQKNLDLTGVTYADELGVKFTFAPQANGNLTLAPGKAVVIWGGGMPQCPGVTNFFINGTYKSLSLNDAGDTITIATGGATPVTIATTTYEGTDLSTSPRRSLNLSPDVTGTAYTLHDMVNGAVGDFSPGKKADGSAF